MISSDEDDKDYEEDLSDEEEASQEVESDYFRVAQESENVNDKCKFSLDSSP